MKKKIFIILAIVVFVAIVVAILLIVPGYMERRNRLGELKIANEQLSKSVEAGAKLVDSQDAVSRKDYIGFQLEGTGGYLYKIYGYYKKNDGNGKIYIDIGSGQDYELNYDANTQFVTKPANSYEDPANPKTPETNPELFQQISLLDFTVGEKVTCYARIKDNFIITMFKLLP